MVSSQSSGGIVVAVNFDDAALGLIHHASLLAKRLDLSLRFVHAVEPVFNYATTSPYPVYLEEFSSTLDDAMKEKQRVAEQKLKSLVETAYSRFPVTMKALPTPFVTEAVLSEATSMGATLVVCGVAPTKRGGVGGFSTALSLMTHSSIPVLVFRAGVEVDWAAPSLRLLVADDCRESGLAALRAAFKIAGKSEKAVVHHMHAADLSSEDVKLFSQAALARSGSPIAEGLTGETLFANLKKEVEGLLDKRATTSMSGGRPANVSYEAHFVSGDVTDAVSREAEHFKPHVIVFGRHQTVHRRPFAIGSVPFRTMLSHDQPVLMAP